MMGKVLMETTTASIHRLTENRNNPLSRYLFINTPGSFYVMIPPPVCLFFGQGEVVTRHPPLLLSSLPRSYRPAQAQSACAGPL